ncbi:MAG: carboxypeptidase regulatory-like domain-containing protein [Bacteroidia bacterium]
MKKLLLFLFIFTFTSSIAQLSTGSLKVHVTDEHGEDILGATVVLNEDEKFVKGSSSDPFGLATLCCIEPGNYLVKVSFVGYETYQQTVQINASNINSVNCQLKVNDVMLSEVVIEKHRKPIMADAYGISTTRSTEMSRLPSRSSLRVIASRGHSRAKEERTKKIEKPKIEKVETVLIPNGMVGVLTAGEVNDFNKFKMWDDLSKTDFETHKNNWQLDFTRRFAVVLKNAENGAVIDALVKLINGDNQELIWASKTNNAGRCELWLSPFLEKIEHKNLKILIEYAGQVFETKAPVNYKKGVNQVKIPVGCYLPNAVDIAFIVDATGSMGDEINYLKDELLDVIEYSKEQNPNIELSTATVFYKDHSDDYVLIYNEFDEDVNVTMDFIRAQKHGGGGDTPEAVDSALHFAIDGLSWSEEARNRLLFLILDAPPHTDEASKKKMHKAIEQAAAQGIRIIPVVCSGNDKSNEYLMRSAALATNGTYIFLTDHSGVGSSHIKPTTDEYQVTYLNDLLKEVIIRFTDAKSCTNDSNITRNLQKSVIDYVIADKKLKRQYNDSLPQILKIDLTVTNNTEKVSFTDKRLNVNPLNAKKFEVALSPNPTPGVLQIQMSTKANRVLLLDASGQMLREYKGFSKNFSVNVAEFADGIYFIAFVTDSGNIKTERFVLQK